MITKALWVTDYQKIELLPYETADHPAFDQVQIEVKACGVCAWDSYLYRGMSSPGPYPYVIGHESVGIVRAVGAGIRHLKPGDKVFCASGNNKMACEILNIAGASASKIPDDVENYAEWVLEPTVCVVNLLHKSAIMPGDHVVLIGAGYMGLLTLQGLLSSTPAGRITVFEPRESSRRLASEYGKIECYDPSSDAGRKCAEEIQAGGGADVVIEFSGSAAGYALAGELVSKGGKLVLGTWHRHDMQFDGTRWHLKGLEVLNLSPMSNRHYTDIVQRVPSLVLRGAYQPGKLISHIASTRDMEKVNTLFMRSIDKQDGYMKGVVLFND